MDKKRAFSLAELIVVVAILLILAALLFPVFSQTKIRAKILDCQARLHQDGLALQMYRADNDGQAWIRYSDWSRGRHYTTAGNFRYPWNDWLPAAPYLKDGNLVWCSLPNRDTSGISAFNLDALRYLQPPEVATENTITAFYPLNPDPSRVVAFCSNHTVDEREKPSPRFSSEMDLWKGVYPVVREDGSASTVKSSQIELWYLWQDGTWHPQEQVSQVSSQVWRFPNEQWPPTIPWQ